MSIKYYASFLLQEASDDDYKHCSGIVEVDRPVFHPFDNKEIERMLAEGLDVDEDEVQILHWDRLH
ncbi:MAG: hypothetical protein AAF438_11115 [Pseudomonadota bacterium]